MSANVLDTVVIRVSRMKRLNSNDINCCFVYAYYHVFTTFFEMSSRTLQQSCSCSLRFLVLSYKLRNDPSIYFFFSSASLGKLSKLVEDSIIDMTSPPANGNVFVIEDVTSLLNIGYTCQSVVEFLHQCKIIAQKFVSKYFYNS